MTVRVVVLDALAAVRKRPGMYLGDTGARGRSRLADFLLHAAIAEERDGSLQQLHLSLGQDGSLQLLADGQPLPPESLSDILTVLPGGKLDTAVQPYGSMRFEAFCAFALSEQYELEAWEEARRWHLSGQAGVIHEHPTPEPLQGARLSGPRGTRSSSPLTAPSSMETPLVVEARWEGVRVRCALRWTEEPDCQVWSFVNTVRARKGGWHVQGVLNALGAAVAQVKRHKKPWPGERLLPGLTLVVAMDAPAGRFGKWYPQQVLFETAELRSGLASVLTPVLVQALRDTDGLPWARR
ncbi:hypothetical protein [Hyalangium gracile]|uniref:hypothetical protein n=1 Tax=Hyalangium gracile TaxID=394092 RepID=UPI001CCD7FAA|nr:hypothetical protein [Hyalangium gracile]